MNESLNELYCVRPCLCFVGLGYASVPYSNYSVCRLTYFQSNFFRGGLCDEPLWVFLHSEGLFVLPACRSRPVSFLEPSAMNVCCTAK